LQHYGHAGTQPQIGHGVDVGISDIGAVVEASAAADPGPQGIAFEAYDDRTVLPILAAGDAIRLDERTREWRRGPSGDPTTSHRLAKTPQCFQPCLENYDNPRSAPPFQKYKAPRRTSI
jgi:hypothetical protein